MARNFRLKAFLREINEGLLQAFLKAEGVSDALPKAQKDQDDVDVWTSFIYSLDGQKIADIETALRDVNEMASEGGTLDLIDIANHEGVALDDGVRSIQNDACRALYFYIHHRAVFDNAFVFQRVNEMKGKVDRTNLKKCSAEEVMVRTDDLAKELKLYFFSKEMRGQNCHVDAYNDHGKRVCFIAYPEDYPKTDLFYVKGSLKPMPRRPAFQIIYIYDCENGRLEMNARGGAKKKVDLMSIFNKEVLQDDCPVSDRQKVYKLERLLQKDFEFATKPEDEVEYVNLQELTLTHRYNKDRVTIALKDADGLDDMRDALKDYHIAADQFFVSQSKIKIKFPQVGRQKGSVTFHLSWPDRCDLGDSSHHLKAKEYVKYWNLEEKPIKITRSSGQDEKAPAESVS